jgi:hypothetical protein
MTSAVNSQGVFNQDVNAFSNDNNVLLHIPAVTKGLTASGGPLTQISIINMTTPPAFQTGAGMVGLAYDFTPAGVTFNIPVTVRFSYNLTSIPTGVDATSLQIAYYDSNQNAWITLQSIVDTTDHFITAQINHFTPYAITYGVKAVTEAPTTTATILTTAITTPAVTGTSTTTTTSTTAPTTTKAMTTTTMTTTPPLTTTVPAVTPLPAVFETSSLIINPAKVNPGTSVNIQLKITNTGNVNGNDTVVLMINNKTVSTQDAILPGGDSTVITFSTYENSPGNYNVEVAGLKGNFTVSKNIILSLLWPVSVGVFLLAAALTLIFLLTRHRQT